jgi:hypothetical protein
MLFARPAAAFTTTLSPLLNTPVAAFAGPPVRVTAEPAIAATTMTRKIAFLPIDCPSVVFSATAVRLQAGAFLSPWPALP